MSGNRRKKTTKRPEEEAAQLPVEPVAARVVAIPKTPETAGSIMPPAAANAAPAPPPVPPKAKPKSDRIGDILRHARLERGDDLYLIAEYLCIKPAFLVALENSRYDEFPADAYVIGFLRTYATFLGVDGKDAVDRYRYEMAGRRKKPVLAMPIPLTEGRAPSSLILVGATVVALLVYALWYGISSSNRTEVNVPPPLPPTAQQTASPDAAAGLTAPVAAPSSAPATNAGSAISSSTVTATSNAGVIPPAAPGIIVTATDPSQPKADTTPLAKADIKATDDTVDAKPADKPTQATPAKDGKSQVYGDPNEAAHIIIRASQTSWILVNDASGKTVFDHVLKAGDIYKVPNQSGLTLTTGNGNGLVVSLDGVTMPKLATGAPHVVKNIPLDAEHLTTEPSAQ